MQRPVTQNVRQLVSNVIVLLSIHSYNGLRLKFIDNAVSFAVSEYLFAGLTLPWPLAILIPARLHDPETEA